MLEGDTGRVSPTQRMSLLTGTFAYRAPELLRGDAPDTRADIYSLGVTLWQMESRQTPYAGHEPHAVVFNVVAYHSRPAVRVSRPSYTLGLVSRRSLEGGTRQAARHAFL